jgi:hypothetical protein
MTFRTETPEIRLLKNLRYNHYVDIGSFHNIDIGTNQTGSIGNVTIQPSVEAFLTTKERFNFEIEVMVVQRGEDGKPSDLVPTKQVIQVTGLGLPNPGNGVQNDVTTKTLKFIDFKVNAIGSFGNYYDLYYGEYWSDDITSIASNPAIIPFERTVTVDINKIGLSNTLENGADSFGQNQTGNPNTFWTNTLPGQVLDIACYLP